MRIAGLDLLRDRVDVAEASLERRPREDRADSCFVIDPVRDFDRTVNGVGRP
jgi:hypothetical protein